MLGLRLRGKLHGRLPKLTVIPSGVSRARLMSHDLYSQTINLEKQVYAAIYIVLPTLLVLWDRLCVCVSVLR